MRDPNDRPSDYMADLEQIPDHRGRVYRLASLLAIHHLAAVVIGNSPKDAADFARDHAAWLRRLDLLGHRNSSARTVRCIALNILSCNGNAVQTCLFAGCARTLDLTGSQGGVS